MRPSMLIHVRGSAAVEGRRDVQRRARAEPLASREEIVLGFMVCGNKRLPWENVHDEMGRIGWGPEPGMR